MPKFMWIFLLCCSVLGVWTLPVEASVSGEGEGWGWIEGVGRFTNLFILLGVIYYFVRKPLGEFFAQRRMSIQQEMLEARQDREEAAKKLDSVEERMKNLDQELAALRKESEEEAGLERRRLLEQAERDAQKIIEANRREIDGLTRAARQQLKDYVAKLSVQLAEQHIRREMSEQDEERVMERLFSRLGGERGELSN